jgi:carboxymethylenebutenolidase
MAGFFAVPEHKGELPGILIFQEIFGVNAHIKDVAKRFAQEGYATLAPELFHRTGPGFHSGYEDYAPGMKHAQAMTPAGLTADIQAAFQWLSGDPHVKNDCVAAIGFCLGGRVAFLANALVPLKAAVSFYGGGIAPALIDCAPRQHGPVMLIWGGLDKHILPEQIRAVEDALRAAGKPYANTVFGAADHGFFCDERPAYNRGAAHQAWALANAFLKDSLV